MQLDLVTPEKLLFSKKVDQVIVPGTEGDFGVMEGHQPLISTLKPGKLTLMVDEGEATYYVANGFVDVTPEKVTVLAEDASSSENLVAKDVESELTAATKELSTLKKSSGDATQMMILEKKVECLTAKLNVVSAS